MIVELKEEMFEFKKSRVLDVASELFFTNGYTKTTLDDIATHLSVTKPFIYQFYANKAELLVEVCLRTTALAAERARIALDDKDTPTDRLRQFVSSLAHEVIVGRMYLAVYFREEKHLPPEAQLRLQDHHRRFNRALRTLLEEGKSKGEFSFDDSVVAMQAITGMSTWIFTWYRPEGRLSEKAVADQLARIALAAVGVSPVPGQSTAR